jgi:hypothetical protein
VVGYSRVTRLHRSIGGGSGSGGFGGFTRRFPGVGKVVTNRRVV